MNTSLEDLMRAIHRLNPADESTRLAIGRSLGFDASEDIQDSIATTENLGRQSDSQLTPPHSFGSDRDDSTKAPEREEETSLDFTIAEIKGITSRMPDWVTEQEDTELLPKANEGVRVDPPVIAPLFRPLWERGILSALFATYERNGAMDVQRVVDHLAEGSVLTTLPRLPVPTLAKGVQLLVDRSAGMLPFQEDLKQVVRSIRKLMGGYALQVLRFSSMPLRGAGKGAPFMWTPYEENWLPARGTRVVCLTDLSIARPPGPDLPADPQEWLAFQDLLRRNDCSLALITPYGPSRWPESLKGHLDIVHWDDDIHIAAVKRIVRE